MPGARSIDGGRRVASPPRLALAGAAAGWSLLAAAGVTATAALALGLTVRSLGWALVHDAPVMHYVARRILEGAAPYRDLFDMNFPGVYLVHVLALVLVGPGDAGFRAFDLLVLAGTIAGLAVALAPSGRWAALSAGALFWLYHVAGGAWRAGQRDFILCLPLAWMTAAVLADLRAPRAGRLALAGASLGVAAWIKPHAVLLLPVLAVLPWQRPSVARVRALAALALGLGIPAAAVVAWLAAAGSLTAFANLVGGYLVPLYSRLGRASLVDAVRGHDLGPVVLGGLGLWALSGLVALGRGGLRDGRVAVLAAGTASGVLHFVLQGKGWEYHLYPVALFAIALGAVGLAVALEGHRRVLAGVLLAALVVSAAALAVKGIRNLEPAWVAAKAARAHAVAAVLAPVVARGGTVQVFDTTDGGIHALYLVGARQPTRFLYDFHFYHDVGHPYVRRLRAELLAGLRARPPAAVVLFERGWPSGDYGRLRAFPELAAWLEAGYRLARDGDGFRVFVRWEASAASEGRDAPRGDR
ncbi:MAG: hypothetical protein HYZ75_11180 [Elusimicrobia bacterium]|nr:hypothetical protein [Elusimicrobiota bacterium]